MILVDSNIPMYLVGAGAEHPHKADAQRLLRSGFQGWNDLRSVPHRGAEGNPNRPGGGVTYIAHDPSVLGRPAPRTQIPIVAGGIEALASSDQEMCR